MNRNTRAIATLRYNRRTLKYFIAFWFLGLKGTNAKPIYWKTWFLKLKCMIFTPPTNNLLLWALILRFSSSFNVPLYPSCHYHGKWSKPRDNDQTPILYKQGTTTTLRYNDRKTLKYWSFLVIRFSNSNLSIGEVSFKKKKKKYWRSLCWTHTSVTCIACATFVSLPKLCLDKWIFR